MSTFSVLGGVLSIMSSTGDENTAVELLAQKEPCELVVLAKTAASLRGVALFRVLCMALFHNRTADQLRRSFGAIDDIPRDGLNCREDNSRNAFVLDLTKTLERKAVLPLMTWSQLDTCCDVCQACRSWAAPEMERRVLAAMQEKSSSDPTMFAGTVADLLKATDIVEAWADSRSSRLNLSGINLAAPGWCGIVGSILNAGTKTLVDLDLSGCLIPFQCAALLSRLFVSCVSLQHVETSHAGDDNEVEGWVFSRWRLHTQQLDQPQAVVHSREEIFLVKVHLDSQEWNATLAKITGSPVLRRLYLTMCWIPKESSEALAKALFSCPELRTVRLCFAASSLIISVEAA